MDLYLSALRDPLFLLFPVVATLVSVTSFALFAAVLTAIAWRDPPSLRRYRIQSRRPRAQTLVGPSIRTWLLNNLLLSALVVVAWPVLRHSRVHAGPLPAWWELLGELVFFIYLDDLLFYGAHRALHHGWLYRKIHAVHHRIATPWAVTGHYMHPVEYVLIGSLMLVGPLLVGAHVVTVWCWVAFRQWEAAEGHAGYDLPWTPTHWLPGSDGARHHDWHHADLRGNYAGFLVWADRLFGTLSPGYREDLDRRRGRAA